jgi:hypothetical protein
MSEIDLTSFTAPLLCKKCVGISCRHKRRTCSVFECLGYLFMTETIVTNFPKADIRPADQWPPCLRHELSSLS